MLSLPLITPHEDLNIWHTNPSHRPTQTVDHTNDTNLPPHANQHASRRQQANTRSALSLLAADENLIEQRKQNVRRFGAGWLRPPGIAKTYQATMDEMAEREEQEILARREQNMLDMAHAAEMEAQRANAETAAAAANEVDRDLDEEIPEAEAEDEVDLDDEVPSASEGDSEEEGGDMTFNEESFIEGSMLQADVEQMLELEEGQSMMQERDLDDDVPEAGAYEHTDTELEDSTSELDLQSSRVISNPNINFNRSLRGHADSSIFGGSSLLGSSPVAGRGGGTGNLFSRAQQQEARRGRQG